MDKSNYPIAGQGLGGDPDEAGAAAMPVLEAALSRLEEEGLPAVPGAAARLERHAALVREWNAVSGLVSTGDAASAGAILAHHTVDALSLAEVLVGAAGPEAHLLDIGSGGGFPALPLKVVLPGLRVTLVERSAKKVGFLRKAAGALGLSAVSVLHGEFPGAAVGLRPDVVTARAVEKPARILRSVRPLVAEGAVFLCQYGDPRAVFGAGFHVEPVNDLWITRGWRRGALWVVRRMEAS